jgi:hypothetical protein
LFRIDFHRFHGRGVNLSLVTTTPAYIISVNKDTGGKFLLVTTTLAMKHKQLNQPAYTPQ